MRGGGLWVDDMYMGTALTSAWAKISGDLTSEPKELSRPNKSGKKFQAKWNT